MFKAPVDELTKKERFWGLSTTLGRIPYLKTNISGIAAGISLWQPVGCLDGEVD